MSKVVITGYGTINPLGKNVSETWDNASAGKNGIDYIKEQAIQDLGVHVGGIIPDYDPLEYFSKKQARNTDLVAQYAIVATREAAEMAKLDEVENRFRISTIIGSGIGGIQTIEAETQKAWTKSPSRVSPYFIPNAITNLVAANVAIDQQFKGQCMSVVTACATGTDAIGTAYKNIQNGFSDIVVCGSSEAAITQIGLAGFNNLKALSNSEDKNRASIPFDKERHGFVMGEGAGIFVLETLESAQKRGATIYGEVIGYGATCDAAHITAPDPEATGIKIAFDHMIESSEYTKEDINMINCHGTSTQLNEKTEAKFINDIFGESQPYVTSSKSMTGHLLGAAGSVEAILTLLSLNNNIVTPTINIKEQDPALNVNLATKPILTDLNVGISTSLAFGGHNSIIMLKGSE